MVASTAHQSVIEDDKNDTDLNESEEVVDRYVCEIPYIYYI